jgi:hypothetical protein
VIPSPEWTPHQRVLLRVRVTLGAKYQLNHLTQFVWVSKKHPVFQGCEVCWYSKHWQNLTGSSPVQFWVSSVHGQSVDTLQTYKLLNS